MLASVIAEAISENFDIGNEAITPYVPVDLREMLSCQAQSNFCCAIALPCSREDMNLSFLELCLQQKDRMKERMAKDNMTARVIAYGDMIREVTKGISLADEETVHGLQKMAVETAKKGKTYLLSNVGRITLPKGMLPYIQNELIYAPVIEDSPMAVVSTFGDTGHFEWHQNNDNDMMAKAIAKAFEKHDIRVRMKDFGRITSDKVQPYLFRRSKNDESQSKS